MEIVIAILCIHMLLWAGCNAAPGAPMLGSNDANPFRRAQPGKTFSRKLLEENTWKPPDAITDRSTTEGSFKTEPISVDPNNARTQITEPVGVEENKVLDPKLEMANPNSASWTTQQEGSVALPVRTDNDATIERDIKPQEASKVEDHTGWNAVDPKERGNFMAEMEKAEKTEDSTTQAIMQSQAEEKPTSSTKEDDAKVSEQGAKSWESAQQAFPQKAWEEKSWQTEQKHDRIAVAEAEGQGNQGGSGVDTQNKWQRDVKEDLIEEGEKDSVPKQKDASVEEVKKESTPEWQAVRVAEDKKDNAPEWQAARVAGDKKDGSAFEQKDVMVEEVKRDSVLEQKDAEVGEGKNDRAFEQKDVNVEVDKKDNTSEQKEDKNESVPEPKDVDSGIQRVEIKEDNPIKMVEAGNGKKQGDFNNDAKIEMVHSSEAEGGDKGQAALESPPASTEEQASSDRSNGERSTPSDTKVEELKIEENNQASHEQNTWTLLQEKSDERGEEKHDENNGGEVSQEKISDDRREEKPEENNKGEVWHQENRGEETREESNSGEALQEGNDDRGEEKREESNGGEALREGSDDRGEEKREENDAGEVLQEKSDAEKIESNDENTEAKHIEESEKPKAEEVPQWKSEENAEAITAENREVPMEDNKTEVKEKEAERNEGEEGLQVKADDDTQTAANEVESQLEAFKRETVFDAANDQRQENGVDSSDDEYDIIQELADLPLNIQETAGRVAEHIRPDLRRWTDTSKVYFNLANQQISNSFSPLIGKEYAPFFASMISYGILLLPLLVVILLFDHIKALFSLQKVLLFINIYLAAYFATLWLASFIIGLEPMSFFYHNSLSSYLSLQILQALGYAVYLILQTANMINSCSSETRVGKVTSTLQWVVAIAIGLHYYVTVFHPAVASKPPHTSWKFYAIYSAAFFVLCLFARIRWVKKRYVNAGNEMVNKKS